MGVSSNPSNRFVGHQHNPTNPIVSRAIANGAVISVLHNGCTKADALAKESQYRPADRIGWNIVAGGGMPPCSSNNSKATRDQKSRKMSSLVWVNDGQSNKRVPEDQAHLYQRGRLNFTPPDTDSTNYAFAHNEHGMFCGTRQELIIAYPDSKINSSELGELIRGRYKTHRGWRVTSDAL